MLKNSPRSRDRSAAGALPGGTASATVDTPYYGDIMVPPITPVDVVSLAEDESNTDRTIRTALRFGLLGRDERHGLLGLWWCRKRTASSTDNMDSMLMGAKMLSTSRYFIAVYK